MIDTDVLEAMPLMPIPVTSPDPDYKFLGVVGGSLGALLIGINNAFSIRRTKQATYLAEFQRLRSDYAHLSTSHETLRNQFIELQSKLTEQQQLYHRENQGRLIEIQDTLRNLRSERAADMRGLTAEVSALRGEHDAHVRAMQVDIRGIRATVSALDQRVSDLSMPTDD